MNIFGEIIKASVNAPSGDNSQPWQFKVRENKIYVYNLAERDIPFYNYEQKGSYIAHGCIIENIKIVATSYGYETNVSLFPDEHDRNLVAVLDLIKKDIEIDELNDFVSLRCTNRKPYEDKMLTGKQKEELLSAVKEIGFGELKLIEDEKEKRVIVRVSGINEKIVLTVKKLHNIFFHHTVWSKREELEKKTGLYVKTLEMNPVVTAIFKAFSHWPVMKFFSYLGFHKIVANENAKVYVKSAVIGAILIDDNSIQSFVKAGRLFERIWLKATKMGLSLHPVTGALFFMQRIMGGETEGFTVKQVEEVKMAYSTICKFYNAKDKIIPLLFRVGYGGEPSDRSSKMEPKIIFE